MVHCRNVLILCIAPQPFGIICEFASDGFIVVDIFFLVFTRFAIYVEACYS